MKKLLLLSASALLSLSAMAQAEAPTLTKAWEYKTVAELPSGADARYGTAGDGVIYTADKAAKKIISWTKDGKSDYVASDNITNTAITIDDAGNIIGTRGWAGGNNSLNFYIVAADTKAITTFDVTLPEGVEKGILFSMGRAVGNVLSTEGGYIYYAPNGQTKVVCVKLVNGQQASAYASTDTGVTFNSTQVQPALSSEDLASETNPANNCYFCTRAKYNQGGAIRYFNETEWVGFKEPETRYSTDGFDVVTLKDVNFGVYPTGTAYNTPFAVVDLSDGSIVAETTETVDESNGSSYYQTIIAEKVSETKANIYQYFAGKRVAMYTFEIPADYATAIESVAVDANAPVEYYNLQGVKVANPENGLFIKKQGNKATKVIL